MGSGTGTSLQIGGMAEQDISGYMASWLEEKAGEAAINRAEPYIQTSYQTAQEQQQPYAAIGQQGLSNLSQMAQAGQPTFNFTGQNLQSEPGYQFQLQQGNQAVQQSQVAKGMGLSGATLKALDNYSQGLAGTSYQNAYNRALQTFGANQQANQQTFNQNYNLAGMGQGAANNLSTLATGYGENMAGLELGRGQVQISGLQGAANTAYQQGAHLQQIGSGMGGMAGGSGSSAGGSPGNTNYSQGNNTNANPGEFNNYQGQGGTTMGGFTSEGATPASE